MLNQPSVAPEWLMSLLLRGWHSSVVGTGVRQRTQALTHAFTCTRICEQWRGNKMQEDGKGGRDRKRVGCKISAVQMASRENLRLWKYKSYEMEALAFPFQFFAYQYINCTAVHYILYCCASICQGNTFASLCLSSTGDPKEYSQRRWNFLHTSKREFVAATDGGPKPHECWD